MNPVKQWFMMKVDWWRSPEPKLLLEHLTVEQWIRVNSFFRKQMFTVQKSSFACHLFLLLAVGFMLLRLTESVFLALAISAFFKLRSIVDSRAHIASKRRRVKVLLKDLKEQKKEEKIDGR